MVRVKDPGVMRSQEGDDGLLSTSRSHGALSSRSNGLPYPCHGQMFHSGKQLKLVLGKVINSTACDEPPCGPTPTPQGSSGSQSCICVQNKTCHQLRRSLDSYRGTPDPMFKSVFLSPSRKALYALRILASYTERE